MTDASRNAFLFWNRYVLVVANGEKKAFTPESRINA
jgi:hypothetical protein